MKEREPQKYRHFLVCSDGHRQITTMTRVELLSEVSTGDVNWIMTAGGKIKDEELNFLKTYLGMMKPEEGIVPNNKDLSTALDISRNEVAKLRKSVGQKLEFKAGW